MTDILIYWLQQSSYTSINTSLFLSFSLTPIHKIIWCKESWHRRILCLSGQCSENGVRPILRILDFPIFMSCLLWHDTNAQKIMSTNPYFSMTLKDVTPFNHLSITLTFHVSIINGMINKPVLISPSNISFVRLLRVVFI